MLTYPDPLLMRADISRVAAEHPECDREVIERLYQNLLLVKSRQPTADELREYVAHMTSSVDELTLRGLLGLGPPTRRHRETRATPSRAASTPARGRPRGSRSVSREQILESYRSLRTSTGRPPTQTELAANLTPRIAKRTLQDLLAEYDLGWPPE